MSRCKSLYDSEALNKRPECQTSAEIDFKSIIFKSKRPAVQSNQCKDRYSIHEKPFCSIWVWLSQAGHGWNVTEETARSHTVRPTHSNVSVVTLQVLERARLFLLNTLKPGLNFIGYFYNRFFISKLMSQCHDFITWYRDNYGFWKNSRAQNPLWGTTKGENANSSQVLHKLIYHGPFSCGRKFAG